MFSLPTDATIVDINIHYSTFMQIISITVAIVGAFTAFSCYARSKKDTLISKKIWIALASISMAVGIWSMHFSGMIAIDMPVQISHNLLLTFVSIIPAIIAPIIAFALVNIPRTGSKLSIMAGIVIGMGIIGMHLIGIYSMDFEGLGYYYDPFWFNMSLIISIVGSSIAVYVFSLLQKRMMSWSSQIWASVVFGIAVGAMHYSNIHAMKFYTTSDKALIHGQMNMNDMTFLSVGFTISILFILMILLTITVLDYYIEKRISFYDPLTRLPNRRTFQNVLETESKGTAVAIWHFHDLESYNLDHGYLFVDRLIKHISQLFKNSLPPLTEIYRTEANRFTFVTKDRAASKELQVVLREIRTMLKNGLMFEGKEITFNGVCAFTLEHYRAPIKKMYLNAMAVLKHPSIRYNFDIVEYDSAVHTRNFSEDLLEQMDDAMATNEIFLVYQPKISPVDNQSFSVEALIRWDHPQHGFLSPGVFLPIFEANDRMIDVTDWIIDQVCQQLKHWKEYKVPVTQVAINVPGPYLTSSRLMDVLKMNVKKYNISPSSIELEITETSFVKTIDSAEKAVTEFRKEGFTVALDDFGTGVSSLSYLKRIPITTLKIDRSFIDGVPESRKDASIVESMIQLGKSLSMEVVVEGVENAEQVEFLMQSSEAPTMQGFYFAKPMRAEEILTWAKAFQLRIRS